MRRPSPRAGWRTRCARATCWSQWAEYAEADAAICDRYLDDALALARRVPPGPTATLPFLHRCYRLLSQGDCEGVLRLSAEEIRRARAADAPAASP